jgi:hypothetical protein
MSHKIDVLVPNPVRGSDYVSYQYAAFTRYVKPASQDKLAQGIWWEDINPADVLPAGLALPPIPLAFRYPDSDGTLQVTDPQNAPEMLPWAHNEPDEYWYYKYAFWVINGGLNQFPADRPYHGMPSPIVQVTKDNVETLAVYDLSGGPLIDTAAWNIAAWIANDHGATPQHPIAGEFFHVLTAPTSQERDQHANDGLVDTEFYNGVKLTLPQVVEAIASVAPTNPFSIEQLQFSHWTLNNGFSNPIPQRQLVLDVKSTGRAIAWYKLVPREGASPEPNVPDWWWRIITRGGLVPPPPLPPWSLGKRGASTEKSTPGLVSSHSAEIIRKLRKLQSAPKARARTATTERVTTSRKSGKRKRA